MIWAQWSYTSLLKQLYLPISGEPHKLVSITPSLDVHPSTTDARNSQLHETTKIVFLSISGTRTYALRCNSKIDYVSRYFSTHYSQKLFSLLLVTFFKQFIIYSINAFIEWGIPTLLNICQIFVSVLPGNYLFGITFVTSQTYSWQLKGVLK